MYDLFSVWGIFKTGQNVKKIVLLKRVEPERTNTEQDVQFHSVLVLNAAKNYVGPKNINNIT